MRRHRAEFITYHEVPSDNNLRKKWQTVINQHSNTPVEVTVYSKVCSKHFLPSDYKDTVRRLLKKGVVPTVFWHRQDSPNQTLHMSQGKPHASPNAEIVNPLIDFYSTTKCTRKECANGHLEPRTIQRSTRDIKEPSTVYMKMIAQTCGGIDEDNGVLLPTRNTDDLRTNPRQKVSETAEPNIKAVRTDGLRHIVYKIPVVRRPGKLVMVPLHATQHSDRHEISTIPASCSTSCTLESALPCGNSGSDRSVQADVRTRESSEVYRWKRKWMNLKRENSRLREAAKCYRDELRKFEGDAGLEMLFRIRNDLEEGDSSAAFLMDQVVNYQRNDPVFSKSTLRQCFVWKCVSTAAYEHARKEKLLTLPP